MFSDEVVGSLGCYVYRLIDPRSNQTFYVGKGRGNRVFYHANGQFKGMMGEVSEDEIALKLKVISAIHEAKLRVVHVVHRHGMDENTAFEVEAALIDAYPNLTNQQGGHDSGDRGCMNVEQIMEKYGLPAITEMPSERLILVNINTTHGDPSLTLLEKAQCEWRMSLAKAKQAQYVLAVERGVVRGVFKPERWVEATNEHFPKRLTKTRNNRIGFIGKEITEGPIREKFFGERGKRIEVDAMKHVQNPIRYCNI